MAYPYRRLIKPRLGQPFNKGHRLSKGLVGLWLMNEGVGDKVFDLSGNGNTGTLTNMSNIWENEDKYSINRYFYR